MVSHLGIEPNHGGRKSRCEFRLVLVDCRPQRYKKNRWRCWSLRLDPCFTPKTWGEIPKMSVWKHFTSTNMNEGNGVSFEWCFQHQISVSWTQGGTSKKSKVYGNHAVNWVMFSPIIWQLVFPPPKKNKWQPENQSSVKKRRFIWTIHLDFLDWCNYKNNIIWDVSYTTEVFGCCSTDLICPSKIGYRSSVLSFWEYSSATIVDDDAELLSKWPD